jgi:hypothetical protein
MCLTRNVFYSPVSVILNSNNLEMSTHVSIQHGTRRIGESKRCFAPKYSKKSIGKQTATKIRSMSDQERIQLEKEQEQKLKAKIGEKLPTQSKQKNHLLKKDRQYFDSADYIIGGKQNEPSQKTIPKTVQKGELLHPSARKLSPRNVEDNAQHSTTTTTTTTTTTHPEQHDE